MTPAERYRIRRLIDDAFTRAQRAVDHEVSRAADRRTCEHRGRRGVICTCAIYLR